MNRSDDFNRTGSVALNGATPSDGGSAWNDPNGQWSTASSGGNVVAFDGNGSGEELAWLDCGATDHQAEVELVRVDSYGGASARLADASNFYFFRATSSGVTELWKKVSGSYTQLATGSLTFTPGVGSLLSLKCVGTAISGWVGASSSASVTDSALASGTGVGIWASGAFQFVNSFAATDLGGGSTFTGTGSLTAKGATLSGSATFSPGTKTASGTLLAKGATLAGSGTFAKPTYTGAGVLTAKGATASGSGTFAKPTYTASATLNAHGATLSGSGIFATAVFRGSGSLNTAGATASGSGTFSKPTYTGSGALVAHGATLSGSATFTKPAYTASGALGVRGALLAASGIFAGSVSVGAGSLLVRGATIAGSATFTPPVATGTVHTLSGDWSTPAHGRLVHAG